MRRLFLRLMRIAFRSPRTLGFLHDIYTETRLSAAPETAIGEASPINCRKSDFDAHRLNLLVPALSLQHVFGGIDTALALFEALGKECPDLRIVLTDEFAFTAADNPAYADWEICSLDTPDYHGRRIVPAGDRYGRTLPVGPNDRFVATAWWTAVSANHIQKWQAKEYGQSIPANYLYVIQDFEPGFYPWSSRYALADATYRQTDHLIAIFNSGVLKSFFDQEGYQFPLAFTFEPALHPRLREHLASAKQTRKERCILVYGRPGVVRNAFEIIVMALREWVSLNQRRDWSFLSAGEPHPPVDLGDGCQLVSLGKLSLQEYADRLARTAVGLSLMISPHPSYPPLEMAAFGVHVLTNRYKSKDLSTITPMITSLDSLDPASIAKALGRCIRSFEDTHQKSGVQSISPEWRHYLEATAGFEQHSASILSALW